MKTTRFAIAAMAMAATLGTPMAAQAATFNNLFTQQNGNMIMVGGSSLNEIKDKLKNYGINCDNIDFGNYQGFPNCVLPNFPDCTLPEFPDTLPEFPGTLPEIPVYPEIPEVPGDGSETGTNLSYAEQVVKLVNMERSKNGLSPLTLDKSVESAAIVRAKEIVNSFSHTRPNGSSFSTALQEQGVKYMASGENIAWGQKSPEAVMQGWMNSAGHRANILNSKFTKIGVGHYQINATNYWTQLFTN